MPEPDEPIPAPEILTGPLPPSAPLLYFFSGDPPVYQGAARVQPGTEVPPGATLLAPPPSWPGSTVVWNGEAWERIDDGELAARKETALEARLAAAITEDADNA